ncbi:MAG TPA: hypothetical protein VNO56_02820 [Gaiellaceae bacterium]|nr:hypothetical protein [Gaiellaceae bacterium]
MEDVLTDDELYWVCCERMAYEPERVNYDDWAEPSIEVGAVECLE